MNTINAATVIDEFRPVPTITNWNHENSWNDSGLQHLRGRNIVHYVLWQCGHVPILYDGVDTDLRDDILTNLNGTIKGLAKHPSIVDDMRGTLQQNC